MMQKFQVGDRVALAVGGAPEMLVTDFDKARGYYRCDWVESGSPKYAEFPAAALRSCRTEPVGKPPDFMAGFGQPRPPV
jgi:uncharacterized protein YodC (DUF2158 family)